MSALWLTSCSTSRRASHSQTLRCQSDSVAVQSRKTVTAVGAVPAREAVMAVSLDSLMKMPLIPQAAMTARDGPLRLTLRRTADNGLEVKAETDSLPRTVSVVEEEVAGTHIRADTSALRADEEQRRRSPIDAACLIAVAVMAATVLAALVCLVKGCGRGRL